MWTQICIWTPEILSDYRKDMQELQQTESFRKTVQIATSKLNNGRF